MIKFDEWWNSSEADCFRAAHEDLDGEHFRPVWNAACKACVAHADRTAHVAITASAAQATGN